MKRIKAEIVVISGSPRFKLIELLNVYETRNIIIDASNPVYKVKQWQKEADSLHVTCHSLKFDGAFILNF